MNTFDEGYKLLGEIFGNKDNLIAVATIAREKNAQGQAKPTVRTVDAFYEDGVFYVVTYAMSKKILEIEQNPAVSVSGYTDMFTANAVGENLGWVLDPKNAEIRGKLRGAFAKWYDMANDENDKNCCILAIRLTDGVLNINHWEKLYFMDFVNKTEMKNM